jgi:hypothetical protein
MSVRATLGDALFAFAVAGLALSPLASASAAIPLCTTGGERLPPSDLPGLPKACHALCETRRRDG